LSKEEGGGYLVEYPDIPGCMSDGETIEEAITNGREALLDCVEVFKDSGRKIPKPSIEAAQWRQRLPRTLYSKLTKQAENEGVSINSLVTAIIAEAIGAKQGKGSWLAVLKACPVSPDDVTRRRRPQARRRRV
jgi:antitoxin HicB